MDLLPCGHVAHVGTSRLCRHLLDPEAQDDAAVWLLTGTGLDHDVCCPACDTAEAAPELVAACEGCVGRVEDEGEIVAWRGRPGIAERPEPVGGAVLRTPLPEPFHGLLDMAGAGAGWLVLTADMRVARFDADGGAFEPLASAEVPDEPDHEPWAGHELRRRLHGSADGRFAAVVNDYGRYGAVIDLRTGRQTLALDGGDYRPSTVPFSVAFTEHRGRTVVVHRTAWNRLDVSDAATGELLTERTIGRESGHDLDYFHGRLHVSPDGEWIADDGWVWHPAGLPAVWSLHRWLDGAPWESEDGLSRRYVCQRWYHWDSPMCWVADGLLAVSGLGTDDEALLDGVSVFDAATGTRAQIFAGPRGELFADARRLYAATDDGLEIWDPLTGELTGRVGGFVPSWHHPRAAELAALSEDGTELLRWKKSAR
ncbi:MAG: hypothetical protein ACRDNL_19350 [Spirillospora sp.]